ncbi:MAG: TetR/AcrR family transcriptional regulator [Solirubrobacterales bacterium]
MSNDHHRIGENSADSSEKPANRRSRRHAEIRERLVRSSLRLFAERGFTATTVEEITNLADVGKGTFFNYFPSKEHVFAARARGQAETVERFLAIARESSESMNELICDLSTTLSEGFEVSPAIFQSIVVAVSSNEAVRGMLAEALEQGRRPMAELLSLGQQRGEIRTDFTPAELAMMFQRAFFGTVFLWSVNPSRPLADCLKEMSNFLAPPIRKGSE